MAARSPAYGLLAGLALGLLPAGTFAVAAFTPAELTPPPIDIPVGSPVGVATMEKVYAGEIIGHSATIFTSAYDEVTGVGTYVAMESFEGSLDGRSGGFA